MFGVLQQCGQFVLRVRLIYGSSVCLARSRSASVRMLPTLAAKQCPVPPSIPLGGKAVVRHTGLLFGHVCPGGRGADPEALPGDGGCSSLKIIRSVPATAVGQDLVSKYDILVNTSAGPPGSLVALLTFSQPIDTDKVRIVGQVYTHVSMLCYIFILYTSLMYFQYPVTLEPTQSSTILLITAQLSPSPSETSNTLAMEIHTPLGQSEACLIYNTCSFCATSEDCDLQAADYTDSAYDKQELTTFGSKIEYHCTLGKEFEIADNVTAMTQMTECQWEGNWTRSSLDECICKLSLVAKLKPNLK